MPSTMCPIRDLTVAAPSLSPQPRQPHLRSIRDLTVAAPLIRDLTVAAPLKQLSPVHQGLEDEASIRDLTVAAPLEACRRGVEVMPNAYPRPHGRGPIEASAMTGPGMRFGTIRDLTVAAPLKHVPHW